MPTFLHMYHNIRFLEACPMSLSFYIETAISYEYSDFLAWVGIARLQLPMALLLLVAVNVESWNNKKILDSRNGSKHQTSDEASRSKPETIADFEFRTKSNSDTPSVLRCLLKSKKKGPVDENPSAPIVETASLQINPINLYLEEYCNYVVIHMEECRHLVERHKRFPTQQTVVICVDAKDIYI
ncbi:hypothetical protein LXL04_020730 [Taraxacum kok-saghyz]